MFCFRCGKNVDEGVRFCKYCGQELHKSNVENNEQQKMQGNERTDESSGHGLTVIAMALLIAIIGVGYAYVNFHVCDRCDKKYVGDAYFDAWDSDFLMCEECAKAYYRGINYTQFKVQ